jgi:hypothetical protein
MNFFQKNVSYIITRIRFVTAKTKFGCKNYFSKNNDLTFSFYGQKLPKKCFSSFENLKSHWWDQELQRSARPEKQFFTRSFFFSSNFTFIVATRLTAMEFV